jgi:hypothetical protein
MAGESDISDRGRLRLCLERWIATMFALASRQITPGRADCVITLAAENRNASRQECGSCTNPVGESGEKPLKLLR